MKLENIQSRLQSFFALLLYTNHSIVLLHYTTLAIVKILDGSTYSTMLLKFIFMHNAAMLDIVNNGTDTIIFKPEEMLGIVDLRSLGYYKIKQSILQKNLSKYYKFERADTLYEHFNKFINTFKRRENRKS